MGSGWLFSAVSRGAVAAVAVFFAAGTARAAADTVFRAGATAVDITPTTLPVIINGGFRQATADRIYDRLMARCIALDDGNVRLAIVVIDSCMIGRELADAARDLAARAADIDPRRIVIAATHTHSAPSLVGCLGSEPDERYAASLPPLIAQAVRQAVGNLQPALAGWAVVPAPHHNAPRRWIYRPDRVLRDPFGELTVRANMHPGYQNPDVIGPSGPADPDISIVSIRARDGRPLAVLANYSMHYFGSPAVSADYFGAFATQLPRLLHAETQQPPLVAIMSQGTSGDIWMADYGAPRPATRPTLAGYAGEIAAMVAEACAQAPHRADVDLAMEEMLLTLDRRVPDAARLAWAQQRVAKLAGALPRELPDIYAREALYLNQEPRRQLRLAAIRIGPVGIAAIPNEVYALTGLKIKARSPLVPTFSITLANGTEGYIPPPEQHRLGGYTTWPARTAGLEVNAEPRIVECILTLLERVSGRPRRDVADVPSPYAAAVLDSRPAAFWRLAEMEGPAARDSSGRGRHGRYEDGVVFYLDGPVHRAAHFAGGRVVAGTPALDRGYALELWFWNGMPHEARAITGWLASVSGDDGRAESLGIGGTAHAAGALIFRGSNGETIAARTPAILRRWHHTAVVREGETVRVYLDGRLDLDARAGAVIVAPRRVFLGGDGARSACFEGRLAEAALYDRPLSEKEIAVHVAGRGLLRGER